MNFFFLTNLLVIDDLLTVADVDLLVVAIVDLLLVALIHFYSIY